jgi:PAS domain S-box-containing protein
MGFGFARRRVERPRRPGAEVERVADERDIEIALCVFREANDALIVFDPRDHRVVDVNPTTLRLTGFERKAALASRISDLLTSPDPNDFRRLFSACQTTGFFHAREGFYFARRDGAAIAVSVSVSRIHTRPEPLGLAIIRDISARMKIEAELREARDTLESRVRERTAELAEANEVLRVEIAERLRVEAELRQAKEDAETAGRVRDRFLAVLSHELRTPLTPVLAVVSALLDGPEAPASLRPTLEMIRRSVSLEARLIDDLLDVTRAGRGKLRLEPEAVDALELIEQAIEICRPEANAVGVRIVVQPQARDHRIKGDPTRFQQVVWNLVQNAVKCAEGEGTIVITTADLEGNRLAVTVSDDGRGIEPDLLPRIFEPFEQGETSLLRRLDGLGLGLSICRSIVEGHGGQISASSAGVGQGATFTFDMPLAEEPLANPSPVEPPLSTARAAADILLVEDNKDVLRYLKLVLEMKGHRVRTATSLASAGEALDAAGFDLLISDIELPDGSGLDLMREVRGRMPGVAISGFGAPDDIRLSLDAGFTLHLTKPLETRRLDEAIREVLAGFRRDPAPPIAP